MATMVHADSKRKYSWWWNSHVSPKNSKWLQENLTDMDVKVKQMIKLIEEDADSFARRAEMYYKKRPELMKLVEDFYRAYRALAERYDHATGTLRQAHRTMAEAFPNQVPFVLADDSPAGSATEADPLTPELAPACANFDPDELQNDSLGLSFSHLHAPEKNEAFIDESDSVTSRRGLNQLNDLFGSGERVNHAKFGEGRARKGLKFHGVEEKEQVRHSGSHDIKARVPSESERIGKAEMEILNLKNALAKLEAEKEAGLLQYQQSLERLSNLESEVSRAREDSKEHSAQARIAEAEVQTLKEALARLEAEREASILQYQQCLDEVSNMEKNISRAEADAGKLNNRASKAETEAHSLKQDLARIEAEKEAAVAKYEECSKVVSDLEDKLLHAEEDAKRINEVADKSESKVETLQLALAKLNEEKEALTLQYQQCLEAISTLEHKLALSEEDSQRLNSELDNGLAKLKGVEEKCLLLERSNQTLHSELESTIQKMGSQSQELTEKQRELGRLWACVQEERLRFMEAETAFQTLQHLHSQSQEELRSLAAELLNRSQILKDMETHNHYLQEEVEKAKEENKGLNELNLSSAVSIKNLQDEILSLKETTGKLEAEVELRVDQRNALQQEIYCLKEELNELNKKHHAMMEQVESVFLNPENFGLSVKELRDENSNLKEVCARDRCEKVALLGKLQIMEKLLEKNALLENSLSDLNVELEGFRDKVMSLEEACQNLLAEKSTLVSEKETLFLQLQDVTDNIKKLSDKKNFLENSILDANAKFEDLRVKSKSLEDLCLLLDSEKSGLITERESLVSQLDLGTKGLEDLEKSYTELEERYLSLEKEKESTLQKVEELRVSFDNEKLQHADYVQLSETQLAGMKLQISLLQAEGQCQKKAYEEYLDKVVDAQIEIFIMQKFVQDLKEKNLSFLFEYQKLLQESKLSEKRIYQLECENLEQQEEVKSLVDQVNTLRVGLYQLLETLEMDADHGCETKMEQDQKLLTLIIGKLREMQISLLKALEENSQVAIENSVLVALLGQLKLEAENLAIQRNSLDEELITIRCVADKLNCEIANGKNVLSQKENELLVAEQMLSSLQNEITELHTRAGDLKCNYDEAKMIQEDQEKKILKLTEDYDYQIKETSYFHQANTKLEAELVKLREGLEETKLREESLYHDLEKERRNAELWEAQATEFFSELQIVSVREVLLKDEAYELARACENLEDRNNSNYLEINQLKENVSTLEGENGGLKSQLVASVHAVISLKDNIRSLENHFLNHTTDNEVKDADLVSHKQPERCLQTSEDKIATVPDGLRDLQDLQMRINTIEKAMKEKERLATEETLNANSKLEVAIRQIEELKCRSIGSQENGRTSKRIGRKFEQEELHEGPCDNLKLQKPTPEISEEGDEVMTKDIMLDQVSEGSSYGLSRRETMETDDRILELWETTGHGSSIDLKVSKSQKVAHTPDFHEIKPMKKKDPTIESLVEKELGVDKLEISKRFSESQKEGSKRKVLERLDSDAQKLTNLQITVQDLKKKVEISEKSIKGKGGIEYDTVKEQLEEAEEAIVKLLDVNRNLLKKIEDLSMSYDGKSAIESGDSGNVRRRKVSEQARRISEKIGRLQLEVQKLQFMLLKLDDEKESRRKTKITQTRVVLRDYLYGYGRSRTGQKKKKTHFCACVQTPTKGD